jgi:hypothetical protein
MKYFLSEDARFEDFDRKRTPNSQGFAKVASRQDHAGLPPFAGARGFRSERAGYKQAACSF